ncbi:MULTISPECIES: hypothetical protein [unclassified Rhizobium]|uniref:hypothetical protein n=1 Tax=unclassified Rhizobium TaxID=2613769 RepID=UPI001130BBC3|nr:MULTISPECIES: hypothetical protein [unclassified Rhizobium]
MIYFAQEQQALIAQDESFALPPVAQQVTLRFAIFSFAVCLCGQAGISLHERFLDSFDKKVVSIVIDSRHETHSATESIDDACLADSQHLRLFSRTVSLPVCMRVDVNPHAIADVSAATGQVAISEIL